MITMCILLAAVALAAGGCWEEPRLTGDGRTDDTAAIQSLIDSGRSCVYLPPPQREYVISRPLRMRSGTELRLDRMSRVRLKPGSSCPMVENLNWKTGDKDIAVTGGIWDYDNVNQGPNLLFSDKSPKSFERDFPLGCIFRFDGVDRLSVRGVTFRNPTTYSCQLTRVSHFTVEDISFDFDKWNPKPLNMDGIHLDGGCHHGRIANLRGTCFDDMVALNANDGICAAYEGPITDIDIDGLYSEYTHRGVRILSTGAWIDGISIRNIHIRTYRNAVAITHFFPKRKERGRFGGIVVRDCSASAVAAPEKSMEHVSPMVWVEGGCDIEQLIIDNFNRTERTSSAAPTIRVDAGAKISRMEVRNCRQRNETAGPLVFLEQNGTIGRIDLDDPVLEVSPGAGENIARMPSF